MGNRLAEKRKKRRDEKIWLLSLFGYRDKVRERNWSILYKLHFNTIFKDLHLECMKMKEKERREGQRETSLPFKGEFS